MMSRVLIITVSVSQHLHALSEIFFSSLHNHIPPDQPYFIIIIIYFVLTVITALISSQKANELLCTISVM